MFGTYRTEGDRLFCMVRKSPEKVFNSNSNINRLRRRKATSNYVFEVPEQDFVFVRLFHYLAVMILILSGPTIMAAASTSMTSAILIYYYDRKSFSIAGD